MSAEMKPLILNAWSQASKDESRVCIEATQAPGAIKVSEPQKLDSGDLMVALSLSGLGLAMAPDDILVADGLVRKVRVLSGCGDDTRSRQARYPARLAVIDDASLHFEFPRRVSLPPSGSPTLEDGGGSGEVQKSVRLEVILEHSVRPTWTVIPGMPVRIEFAFSRSPLADLLAGVTIAIDPGHGGSDRGARGPVNLLEKDVALDIAVLLEKMLTDCGATPIMSRDRDCDVDPRGWAIALSAAEPALLVEIHTSNEKDPMTRSYHVAARRGSEKSEQAARQIAGALTERMGLTFPGIEQSDFVAIPLWPAVRVEPLCLTHFVDEANFRAPLFRKRIAQAIFNGICRYLAAVAGGSAQDGAPANTPGTKAGPDNAFDRRSEAEEAGQAGNHGASERRQDASGQRQNEPEHRQASPLQRRDNPGQLQSAFSRQQSAQGQTTAGPGSGWFSAGARINTGSKDDSWDNAAILRIRTHLLTEKDDVAGVIARYTEGVAETGDIVGISESVVAIMQGRAIPPEEIHPGLLARTVCRFAHPDASISAPRSMEMAIRDVGPLRILVAAAAGLAGKILGIRGLFFRVAGHAVAEIDDSGGTMPPYDRSIILGPADADGVARQVWRRTGLWTLILDVNDKGAVDILGTSIPLSPAREASIKRLLRSNPFGNDDQKTTLVVLKTYGFS